MTDTGLGWACVFVLILGIGLFFCGGNVNELLHKDDSTLKAVLGDLPDCETGGLTISSNPYNYYCTLQSILFYCERDPTAADPHVKTMASCTEVVLV